jgi:ABC-type multidrug transport system ATPase subunit
LGLQHVQDSFVGSEGERGISGGQKKRVSIGVEIIHLPQIIFLDEPTTGLDSAISFEVMSAVRKLANQQRTIVCTIHQPSPQTYALFDKLLLLAHGKVIYYGVAKEVVRYFSQSVYEFPYLAGSNPAEYAIAVASGSILPGTGGGDREVDAEDLSKLFQRSAEKQSLEDKVNTEELRYSSITSKTDDGPWTSSLDRELEKTGRMNNFVDQIPVLIERYTLVRKREYFASLLSIGK